ncbi:MAG: SPOR domain-containing protein [Rhodanobacter sp.]
MNTRLLGAAVLIVLAVLFVPMFFSSKPPAGGDQTVSLAIPPAPDGELQTRTMSLNPQVPSSSGAAAAGAASAQGASRDQLATVNIGSNRPLDVETDRLAGKPHENTTVTMGTGASSAHPVIPMQAGEKAGSTGMAAAAPSEAPAAAPKAATPPPAPKPAAPAPAAASAPVPAPATATASDGAYLVNLGAYANARNVESLQRQVKTLGYASSAHAVTLAGKKLTQVAAGPFATRTAAEAARLKIAHNVQGLRPTLDREDQAGAATAQAAPPKSEVAGWAVQVAALGSEADANALRDKLRAGGFDGYVNPMKSGGEQLWQVRAGPMTQRADAQHVQDEIKTKLGINGVIRRVP